MAAQFQTRTIRLVGAQQCDTAIAAIQNAPREIYALEVIIREAKKVRGLDANARMWVGPLADIAAQAWMNRRQYSAEVWHEYAKREFLPDTDHPDLDRLVKDPFTWAKWDFAPNGDRICVGSTTKLTPYGMSQHMMQLEAFGASLGVLFSASPAERREA